MTIDRRTFINLKPVADGWHPIELRKLTLTPFPTPPIRPNGSSMNLLREANSQQP